MSLSTSVGPEETHAHLHKTNDGVVDIRLEPGYVREGVVCRVGLAPHSMLHLGERGHATRKAHKHTHIVTTDNVAAHE